jgi:hypothetical protein
MKEEDLLKWDLLAMIFGYNELAKVARTLGEKVFLRMARDAAQRQYESLGGQIDRRDDETICTISEFPKVEFSAKDIDLMKKAIDDYTKDDDETET